MTVDKMTLYQTNFVREMMKLTSMINGSHNRHLGEISLDLFYKTFFEVII
jgi:hypothetical protein